MKKTLVTLLMLGVIGTTAQAAVIYAETFPNPATSGTDPVNIVGWVAYRNDGVDLSSTVNGLGVQNGDYLFRSGGTNNMQYAAISDAGSIDPTAYQTDLTISFVQNDTLDTSTTMGNRVIVKVGSTIYASSFLSASGGNVTRNVVVSDSVWHVWTGETDFSDGFDIGDISGAAGTLAAGSLSNIGLLIVDGTSGVDRQRVPEFSITGTVIPEPSSAMLLGLATFLLSTLRRRGM